MNKKRRKSQNMVEVIFIIPLLIMILLAIVEYAVFQRNVATVQDIAVDAGVAASKYYVDESIVPGNPFTENPAVEAAVNIVMQRIHVLGEPNLVFKHYDWGPGFGQRPFALYDFYTTKTVRYKGRDVPVVTFSVDYRDPVQDGVSTQLAYHYQLMFFALRLCYWTGRCLEIIPGTVQISSTQTKQYVHY